MIKELSECDIKPTLTSILVGNDGGAKFYTKIQKKKCMEIGVEYNLLEFDDSISYEEMREVVHNLNRDKGVHGIIIQTPLPEQLVDNNIFECIDPEKDVDCQTLSNIGKLYKGEGNQAPCTAESAMELLKWIEGELSGRNVVILGRSNVVGKPLVQLLSRENCTVTLCHSKTANLKKHCKMADIIISCMGKPHMIDDTFISDGVVLIDVGTSDVDGRITGDINFDKVKGIAKCVTAVPGGVGPLTTSILIRKIVENAYNMRE